LSTVKDSGLVLEDEPTDERAVKKARDEDVGTRAIGSVPDDGEDRMSCRRRPTAICAALRQPVLRCSPKRCCRAVVSLMPSS